MNIRANSIIVVLGIANALGCGVAAAQDAEGIETVTVTAEKRAENVQTVPISMQVVSGDQLNTFQTDTLSGLQNSLPNVYVMNSPGDDAIYIRGFGSNATNFSFDPSVSMYVDGIYAGRGPQFMTPFFDVSQVEVLRGPQGALFGKNTAAGALNITTNNPTDGFEAAVTASYNFTLKGTEDYGYISGPITDNFGARLAVKYIDEGGWVPNIATGSDEPRRNDILGRLSLKYDPASNLDIVTKVEYDHFDTDGYNTVTASLTAPSSWSTTQDADNPFGHPNEYNINSFNTSTTANLILGDYTLTSITGYSQFTANRYENAAADDPTIYFPAFLEKFHQFSQEVRLLSPTGGAFEYVLGAYYDNSTYDLTNLQRYDLLGGLLDGEISGVFHQTESSYSIYGQGTYHFTDALRLVGSLRYSNTQKEAAFDQSIIFGAPLAAPVSTQGKLNEGEVDPSGSLQYDVAPGVMLYATYGHGSKAGGFVSNSSGVTAGTFMFKPERSTNYEAGIKSTFDDNRMVFDLSAYDTKFANLQVSVYDPTLASFITGNAASATSKGFEATYEWAPLGNLDFRANGAYTDATYDNFPGATCLASETIAQCNPADPGSIAANNIAGTPLPFVSKWSGDLQGHLAEPVFGNLQLDTTAELTYRSSFYNDTNLSAVYGIQKSFVELNARIQLGDRADVWDVALVGTNLTDHRVIDFVSTWPFPLTNSPHAFGELEETRAISIEATYHF
ncbi:MAG: TonB-dependent receptor [Rhizomicrobium sp.]